MYSYSLRGLEYRRAWVRGWDLRERCTIPFSFAYSKPEMSRKGLMRGRLGSGGRGRGLDAHYCLPKSPVQLKSSHASPII